MNREVKEIIQKIEDVRDNPAILDDDGWCDNWMVMSAKECKILLDYINQLETKINTYENSDDMTLMFMWCDEKAKDKINQLETNRDEAIKLIVEDYYSGTTIDINSIGYTTNKMLKVKNILERGKE